LAAHPNVIVKLGGLGMTKCGFGFEQRVQPPGSGELAEAWRPYIETCIEAFGAMRCMFESNYPADRESCGYSAIWNAFKLIVAGANAAEKSALFRDNAHRFYRIA
jgi:L-fuconolactonase